MPATSHLAQLPSWPLSSTEERRFRFILLAVLLLIFGLSLLVPLIAVEKIHYERSREVPPRLAKLVMQRKQTPPVVKKPVQKKTPAVKKKPPKKKKQAHKKKTKSTPKALPKKPHETVAAARKKAARSGLLALRNELAALRSNEVLKKIEHHPQALQPTQKSHPPIITRPSLIDKDISRASQGIDTRHLSRATGDTQLAEHQLIQVVSPGDANLPAPGENAPGRSNEEIKLVFDMNKGKLNKLYNRALRKNPALEGKVVLQLSIAPSGEVTECSIVSSELHDPRLERKLVARILLFDFGPKDVDAITITYPLAFYPG